MTVVLEHDPPPDAPADAPRRLACVTGRFQPLHHQHVELFDTALAAADCLVVAITNPDVTARTAHPSSSHRHTRAANPFTYFERTLLVEAVAAAHGWRERLVIVPFDLGRPATWSAYVPTSAEQYVRVFSAWERHKADLLASHGYRTIVLPGNPSTKLAATDVRSAFGENRWHELVPAATVGLIEQFLRQTPMAARR